jgi:hypothetical protein
VARRAARHWITVEPPSWLPRGNRRNFPPVDGLLVGARDVPRDGVDHDPAAGWISGRAPLKLQVSFPLVAYQAGNLVDDSTVKLPLSVGPVAPGDLRIEGRVVVFRNEPRTFKLGVAPELMSLIELSSAGGSG